MSFTISAVSADEFVAIIHAAGRGVPVEQSPEWARYDNSLPGRRHWRYLVVRDGEQPVAALSLTEFAGRALVQLWAKFAPVWFTDEPTAEQERALRNALATYVKAEHPKAALVRLHAIHAADDLTDPLIEVFYDRTLVLDITRTEDELLAAMTKSGRRDLRYGLKNDALVFTDETGISEQAFADEVFPVFTETAERGQFGLRPATFYYNMLSELGPEVCRLYTVRDTTQPTSDDRGTVVAWAFVTIYDAEARYFYAATTASARKSFAANRMVWECMLAAKERGATTFDFMGLGSDRAPALSSLDGFKLKFGKDGARDVPGPWDLVIKPQVLTAYHASNKAKALVRNARANGPATARALPKTAVRTATQAATTAAARLAGPVRGATPGEGGTPAVLPVVLDFTLSGYALARAFHERYGLTSALVVPFTTGATADSTLFHDVREVGFDAINNHTLVLDEIRRIAGENPELTIIPLTNNDGYVQSLSAQRDSLGANVVVPHEAPEMLVKISDKNHFNAVCAEAGVLTPGTVVLDFAHGRPSADLMTYTYPIIVKPADSALHNALSMPGKKKLYEVASREELDSLLDRLAAAGFTGEMLAQDMIPGDDLISVTIYRARNGEITLARTSKVLLQDPRPAFLGIPDVQVVRDMPDVVEASAKILETAGYYGFANLDAIRDPRDGSVKFFEVNPRYGRNCYYATGSGANVAEQLVTDLVEGRPMAAPALTHELVYTVLPPRAVARLLPAGPDRETVARLVKQGHWADPIKYDGEKNVKHKAYAEIAAWNHARAYRGAPRVIGG